MIKYKILKKYPGLNLKVGDIVSPQSTNDFTFSLKDYPEFFKEVIEIPEYVECVKLWIGAFSSSEVGKIYKTSKSPDFSVHTWNNIYFSTTNPNFFKPSTKEAYDLQEIKNKYIIGKWYTNGDCYTKFLRLSSHKLFFGSEHIDETKRHKYVTIGESWMFVDKDNIREATLEEIQQYLPEGHPDKLNKDWEITAFIHRLNTAPSTLRNNGKYIFSSTPDNDHFYNKEDFTCENLLKNKNYSIFSVRRKSDGVVFSLGDKISNLHAYSGHNKLIKKIVLTNDNQIQFQFDSLTTGLKPSILLQNAWKKNIDVFEKTKISEKLNNKYLLIEEIMDCFGFNEMSEEYADLMDYINKKNAKKQK